MNLYLCVDIVHGRMFGALAHRCESPSTPSQRCGMFSQARTIALVLVCALLTACGQPLEAKDGAAREYDRYVALGDSYTAAPDVPYTDPSTGCLRSNHNYPSLVADQLHVSEFVDSSCSGATTNDLFAPRTLANSRVAPPQAAAVTRDTDLVTLGIGFNDGALTSQMTQACLPMHAPTCLTSFPPRAARMVATIGTRIASVVEAVKRKAATNVRILVIGYPRIAPTTSNCPALPEPVPQLRQIDAVVRMLDAQLRQGATRAGATFVDTYRPSVGHDVCSAAPWINGLRTDPSRALALHPFGAEQEAVARLVVRTLERGHGN